MEPLKKGQGERSRLKKRAISNYLFHAFYQTLSAAIMATPIPPKKRKRARSRLNLPPELIEEILLNLPHKSLVRFSAVSKSWKSMIFDPVFARKHKNRAALLKSSHKLVLNINEFGEAADFICQLAPISLDLRIKVIREVDESREEDEWREEDELSNSSFSVSCNAKDDEVIDFTGQFEGKPRLLAFCDELWCVEVENSLFLWNPSMRNIVKAVPHPSPFTQVNYGIYFICGLAYDSVNDDYKILKIKRRSHGRAELYSLKHDCWRKMKSFSPDILPSYKQKRCEFVGGRFHWIGFTTDGEQVIASFDLSTEKYWEVALPHDYDDEDEDCTNELEVLTLNGKLCAYVNYTDFDIDRTRFVFWVMEEYGVENSWTKRFDFIVPNYCFMSPGTSTPLYLSDNNDLLVKNDTYIVMYRIGEARPIFIVEYETSRLDDVDGFLYVESLITQNNFSMKR